MKLTSVKTNLLVSDLVSVYSAFIKRDFDWRPNIVGRNKITLCSVLGCVARVSQRELALVIHKNVFFDEPTQNVVRRHLFWWAAVPLDLCCLMRDTWLVIRWWRARSKLLLNAKNAFFHSSVQNFWHAPFCICLSTFDALDPHSLLVAASTHPSCVVRSINVLTQRSTKNAIHHMWLILQIEI